MTENMSQPVFVVGDQDAPAVGTLVSDLERRFAADYRVVDESSPAAALHWMSALHEAGDQVPPDYLLRPGASDAWLERPARSRSARPYARQILLIDDNDQRMLDVVAQARRPCMCDKSPVSAPAGPLAGPGLVDAVVASDGLVLMSRPGPGLPGSYTRAPLPAS